MLILKTPRLILRPFQEADLEAFVAYRSDPEVARYQTWEAPFSFDQAREFLREMDTAQPGSAGEWYQFAVERQERPGLIGDCAFQVLAEDARQAQIGFSFSRSFQKQGYATEAVRRMLDYLFSDLNLHRVSATCDVENKASYRLMERIGMRREAHFVENAWFKGAWSSEFVYGVLSREWKRAAHPGSGNVFMDR